MKSTDRMTILQILGQVIICDGVFTDEEHDYLAEVASSLGLTPREKTKALSNISVDSPAEARAATLEPAARSRLLSELDKAINADEKVVRVEQQFVERIRRALD